MLGRTRKPSTLEPPLSPASTTVSGASLRPPGPWRLGRQRSSSISTSSVTSTATEITSAAPSTRTTGRVRLLSWLTRRKEVPYTTPPESPRAFEELTEVTTFEEDFVAPTPRDSIISIHVPPSTHIYATSVEPSAPDAISLSRFRILPPARPSTSMSCASMPQSVTSTASIPPVPMRSVPSTISSRRTSRAPSTSSAASSVGRRRRRSEALAALEGLGKREPPVAMPALTTVIEPRPASRDFLDLDSDDDIVPMPPVPRRRRPHRPAPPAPRASVASSPRVPLSPSFLSCEGDEDEVL